jgi:hypothetical protein
MHLTLTDTQTPLKMTGMDLKLELHIHIFNAITFRHVTLVCLRII